MLQNRNRWSLFIKLFFLDQTIKSNRKKMTVYVYRDRNLNGIKIIQNNDILKTTQIAVSEYKNEQLYNTKYCTLKSAINDFFYFLKAGVYKMLYTCISNKITPCYYIISCFPIHELYENQIIISLNNVDEDIDYHQTRYQQQLHLSTSSNTLDEKYKQEDKPNRDVFDAIDII